MGIQVYATKVTLEAERDTSNVHLEGFDTDQVLAEFTVEEIIDYLLTHDHADAVRTALDELEDDGE